MIAQALDDARQFAGGSVQLTQVRQGGLALFQLPCEHLNIWQACSHGRVKHGMFTVPVTSMLVLSKYKERSLT